MMMIVKNYFFQVKLGVRKHVSLNWITFVDDGN